MPDDVGVTDAALVELVARALCSQDARDKQLVDMVWRVHVADARAAMAAMQPTLDAAREDGRREGLEQAAQRAEQVHSQYYLGGNLVQVRQWDDGPAISCAIRALIPAAPAPMEAADAR